MEYDFKKREKPGGSTIREAIWLAGRDIVIGEKLDTKESLVWLGEKVDTEKPYVVTERLQTSIYIQYSDAQTFDSYLEAFENVADRIKEKINEIKKHRAACGIEDHYLTQDICIQGSAQCDYLNQYVLIKAECLAPEFRVEQYQIMKAESGNGCSPHAIGQSVFGMNLFEERDVRYDRSDIAGIINPEKMPEWAKSRIQDKKMPDNEPEREV